MFSPDTAVLRLGLCGSHSEVWETRVEKPPSHTDHSGSGLRQGLWLGWNLSVYICDHGATTSRQTLSLLNHNMTNVSVVDCSDRLIWESLFCPQGLWGCYLGPGLNLCWSYDLGTLHIFSFRLRGSCFFFLNLKVNWNCFLHQVFKRQKVTISVCL